jgi:Domain of unknown function (DUF1918)
LGVGHEQEEFLVKVGDSVEASTRKIGQTPRTGLVTAVNGALITVRWDSGHETSLIPAAGSLSVVGAKTTTEKATASKNDANKAAAKRPAKKKATKRR